MKPVRLYNTLSRRLEEFTPQSPDTVTLYTCGPTVYNYYHIGNLRNAVFNDTLRRALTADGHNVKHVMNITDVGHLVSDADDGEDKLEKGAKREGKTVWEVAEHYTLAFKSDMGAMNVLAPNGYQSEKYGDTYARATEFIDSQIEMVTALIAKGFAYQTEQAVYFEVSKLPDYGALTGQKLADKENAVRSEVVTDSDKRSPHDFAVWFFATGHFADHSMQWDSPWGSGFPGWHLECSAIIHTALGDPIDIHTGGVDHIGTHHPNEMAQTEAAFGHPLAHFWVHNEFMLVDGAKMSKSKGNSYTLADLTKKGFSPLAYRLLCLQAHYRSELNFTWESLEAAQNTLTNLYAFADLRFQSNLSEVRLAEDDISSFLGRVKAALADDLSTTIALAEVFNYTTKLSPGMTLDQEDFEEILSGLDDLLGLDLNQTTDISDAQKAIIAERETVRAERDWAGADRLRVKLRKDNIEISDTPNGPRWRRSTPST
jgi:cysteinyl-tRNA synthetase